MYIMNHEPDPIAKLALTPRKQTPEMAQLEWSDDFGAMLKPFYIVALIVGVMALVSLIIHFG